MNGNVFNIERFTLHDGPGIRTTVFLKGCPLRCLWCSNPESQATQPEIAYFPEKCLGCGNCVSECSSGAISIPEKGGSIILDFKKCSGCGKCVAHCYSEALVLIGKTMSADEVFQTVSRDFPYFHESGGGVTISGGEPLFQSEFSKEILKLCKSSGIHTALQTSGYGNIEDFEKLLPYLDLLIFDIKHLDRTEHFRCTGVGNETIMSNLGYLESKNQHVLIQVPLIPEYNDSEFNIGRIIDLFNKFDVVKGVSLVPYHRFGVRKYEETGRKYRIQDIEPPSEKNLASIEKVFMESKVPLVKFNG